MDLNRQLLDKRISPKHFRRVGHSFKPALYMDPNFLIAKKYYKKLLSDGHCFFMAIFFCASAAAPFVTHCTSRTESWPFNQCQRLIMVHFSLCVPHQGKILYKHFPLPTAQMEGQNLPIAEQQQQWKYSLMRVEVRRAACFLSEVAKAPPPYSLVCNKTGIKSLVSLQVAIALPTVASPPTPQVRKRCGRGLATAVITSRKR